MKSGREKHYRVGTAEYERLEEARSIDPKAAVYAYFLGTVSDPGQGEHGTPHQG